MYSKILVLKYLGKHLKKRQKLLLIKQLQRRHQKLVNILERTLVIRYFPCYQKVKNQIYNARLSVNFKVDKLADHAAIAVDDNIGTVKGSNSLIKKIQVRAEGREVYDCDYVNHCVNIKNLLEYNPSYAKSVGTNEYYFPDTSRSADSSKYTKRRVAHRQMLLVMLMMQD